MRSFFKFFFASLLAMVVFFILIFAMGIGIISSASSEKKPEVKEKTVLLLDLSKPVMEQKSETGLPLPGNEESHLTGLYDLVRAIDRAGDDPSVKGIYLAGEVNPNGFATTDEIRSALERFKKKGKFLIAYANYLDERAYGLASVCDDIYLNPAGGLEWKGYAFQMVYFKDALDRLQVKPEIFYAGKFKSATEPFRLNKMSDANRLQMTELAEEMYSRFLHQTARARGLDSAGLRSMAAGLRIRQAGDAVQNKLITRVAYDDEVKQQIAKRVGAPSIDKIHFMPIADYVDAKRPFEKISKDKIGIIYAQGDIVDGAGSDGEVGGETFRQLIRKARLDKQVKAVVLRVNSPGGSSLASEVILRELTLLKKEKPLVVSMGDLAASGGYFISCHADTIFAQPGTLTGSIGVFALLFDVSKLMSQKLGITFDEVTTTPNATIGTPFRNMKEAEKNYFQQGVDSVYMRFKQYVASGRKMTVEQVDSIAQGRVWTGARAQQIGLVDRIGNIRDAVQCAARMAKLKEYGVKEWPKTQSLLEKLMGDKVNPHTRVAMQVRRQLGEEFYFAWKQVQSLKQMSGKTQMRLPFYLTDMSHSVPY